MRNTSVRSVILLIPFLLFYGLPFAGAAEKEERKVEEEVIYSIMVDRFHDGENSNNQQVDPDNPDAYHGGDLQGIIDKLDYIKERGFTTIMLSPIMENAEGGYHGFWIEDFRSVEEQFGSLEDAKRLVEAAHQQDMKVILTTPLRYTSDSHSWVEDSSKDNWYEESQENNTGEFSRNYTEGLPKLNFSNASVQEYALETLRFWKEETGADGFRISSMDELPISFIEKVDTEIENTIIIGDVQQENKRASLQNAGVDLVTQYSLYEQAASLFSAPGGNISDIAEYQLNEEQGSAMLTFVDNLYTERFTNRAFQQKHNPTTRWKLALTYLYATPGTPSLYYGSEIALDSDHTNNPIMNFKSGESDIKAHMEQLAAIRGRFPALRKGSFEQIIDDGAFAVFKRSYQGETVYIAINNDVTTKSATLSNISEDKQLRGLVYDTIVRNQGDNQYKIALDRETADIYVEEDNQGVNLLFVGAVILVMGAFIGFVIVVTVKNKQKT
ncbi:alpha-amylase family glycosyl hydrolase [Pontibacillus salicampi]|uniref:Alpha-amylase family glycosyl hydrolase n=1 Tax=Pontibacillus salicampi TaxID=1449801 RepID=A0ABV6LQY7_9BACI